MEKINHGELTRNRVKGIVRLFWRIFFLYMEEFGSDSTVRRRQYKYLSGEVSWQAGVVTK